MPRTSVIVLATLGLIAGLVALAWYTLAGTHTNPLSDVPGASEPAAETPTPPASYVEVIDGCGPHFEGACANVRLDPTTTAPSILRLRTGVVLAVASTTITDDTGRTWYRIVFTEWIRYPDRVAHDWFIAEDSVRPVASIPEPPRSDTKRIVVDRSEQMLYAYDGDELFMQSLISTGLDPTPTLVGEYSVYRKTPSRYMQGPLPGSSDQYYDLPGVPWNIYFYEDGSAIHGAYWHDEFGVPHSHGCVNLPLDAARKLYEWTPIGTPVVVRD